jgi:hypothetical protein
MAPIMFNIKLSRTISIKKIFFCSVILSCFRLTKQEEEVLMQLNEKTHFANSR